MLRRQLFTALKVTIALLVLTAVVYPAAVWAVGQVAFTHQANGSFVETSGRIVGSSLIGQNFSDKDGNPIPSYFQPRPSAAGKGYDPTASGGSNLGPSNTKLWDEVRDRVAAYRQLNGLASNASVPIDAVTASGSGLDPDISVANALDQAARVASARRLSLSAVKKLIDSHTDGQAWGILGEKTVNVLDLNLALDKLRPPG
ncbi:MAG: K(+)-transporting ATPase subunit C [Acidimicrobiia bacterium]|nr:K(+)-transporting ATPase subunit C [Acidimicrobiia bacterium]